MRCAKPLDDRGLADARLADQHRIVLRAPLQDLNRAADLVVAADHRIELALLRALGQIDRVFVQRLALAFGFCAIDLVAAAYGVDRRFQRLLRQSVLARESAEFALVVGHREQEHLACNEAVTASLRLLVGSVQQRIQFAAYLHLAVAALHLRQAFDQAIKRLRQRYDVDASSLQQRPGASVALPQHRQQHVRRIDVLVVMADRNRLRIRQRFLEFCGQFVEAHVLILGES